MSKALDAIHLTVPGPTARRCEVLRERSLWPREGVWELRPALGLRELLFREQAALKLLPQLGLIYA